MNPRAEVESALDHDGRTIQATALRNDWKATSSRIAFRARRRLPARWDTFDALDPQHPIALYDLVYRMDS
jgi:hypothetical protein